MSWFLAYPTCIDYTVEFETEEEGLEYLRKHPESKFLSIYHLEYGFSKAGQEDEDEQE